MQIKIPKVIVSVDMGEYAPELAGRMLQVWVNPPLDVLSEHAAILVKLNPPVKKPTIEKDGKAEDLEPTVINPQPALTFEGDAEVGFLKWYAFVWSQGGVESHWSVDELREIDEQDPAFLSWMIGATWEVRKAHIDRKKKV